MKKIVLAAIAAAALPAAAFAQADAPDGSRAFGIEPYIGIMGGYHNFDSQSEFGRSPTRGGVEGALIQGVAGVNVPLGPVFVGAEGNIAKGFRDIDWEYGAKGRAGFRAGESGLIYASVGYQWVETDGGRGFPNKRSSTMYGLGVEVGPKEIGLGGILGESGPRLRLEANTYSFDSLQPMAGVVWHF